MVDAGLMVLAAAKAFSASSVAITDIRPGNLPLALQLGAAHALDQSRAKSTAETVESFRAVFPKGPDIVIDCEGLSSTLTVRCVHTIISFHFIPYSLGCGASCDSPDILAYVT